jgi:site-specific DNA-methyltransferase (adenine-specific)
MIDEVMFSSESGEWETPLWLFVELDKEFQFELDAAASEINNKCDWYYTLDDDALSKPWTNPSLDYSKVFVNPPYGTGLENWVKKAYLESQKGATVVMVLPARTDTKWFHDWVLGRTEIRFLRGRIKFERYGEQSSSAPFPSMIVIFRPPWQRRI